MRSYIVVVLIAGLMLGGCSTKEFKLFEKNAKIEKSITDEEYAQEATYEYKIMAGDRIQVSVFNQSSSGSGQLNQLIARGGLGDTYLTRDGYEGMLVPKDGAIRLPLIGAVNVIGLTETKAAEKLIQSYKKYLRNPFVSVKILDQRLFVLGEVNKPGVVKVPHGTMTLFEALASTGDLTDDAKRTNILILRGDLRSPTIRQVDLTNMSTIRLSSLILRPNDIIYVQPRDMKAYNVAFQEQKPFFEMIHTMLLPFVDVGVIHKSFN
jgi:polysaccharide export outer membrane protein